MENSGLGPCHREVQARPAELFSVPVPQKTGTASLSTLPPAVGPFIRFPSEFTSRRLEGEGQDDDRTVAGISFPFSPEEEPFLNLKLMRKSEEGRVRRNHDSK